MAYPSEASRRPQGYYELSRTLTYSAIAVIPLLVLYEVGAWWLNYGSPSGLRNAADVTLKEPFLLLGPYGRDVFVALVLAGIWAIYQFETKPRKVRVVRPYLLLMLAESAIYATLFGGVINFLMAKLLAVPFLAPGLGSLDLPSRFVLSLGAGLYEELVFRVMLVSALFLLLHHVGKHGRNPAYVAAALLGAVIFSAYHYIGPMGDAFTLHSFLFRFLAGLILNVLYLLRGFGIAAYTHAFYDLLVTIVWTP
jgi:hypothetical protein